MVSKPDRLGWLEGSSTDTIHVHVRSSSFSQLLVCVCTKLANHSAAEIGQTSGSYEYAIHYMNTISAVCMTMFWK